MKSGLYACAGASATASAAAWAKRFDEPITKESNVYLGLIPPGSAAGSGGGRAGGAGGRGGGGGGVGGGCLWRALVWGGRWFGAPVASLIAARISSTKWPSI